MAETRWPANQVNIERSVILEIWSAYFKLRIGTQQTSLLWLIFMVKRNTFLIIRTIWKQGSLSPEFLFLSYSC